MSHRYLNETLTTLLPSLTVQQRQKLLDTATTAWVSALRQSRQYFDNCNDAVLRIACCEWACHQHKLSYERDVAMKMATAAGVASTRAYQYVRRSLDSLLAASEHAQSSHNNESESQCEILGVKYGCQSLVTDAHQLLSHFTRTYLDRLPQASRDALVGAPQRSASSSPSLAAAAMLLVGKCHKSKMDTKQWSASSEKPNKEFNALLALMRRECSSVLEEIEKTASQKMKDKKNESVSVRKKRKMLNSASDSEECENENEVAENLPTRKGEEEHVSAGGIHIMIFVQEEKNKANQRAFQSWYENSEFVRV